MTSAVDEAAIRRWLVDYLVTNNGCSPEQIDAGASMHDLGVGSRDPSFGGPCGEPVPCGGWVQAKSGSSSTTSNALDNSAGMRLGIRRWNPM